MSAPPARRLFGGACGLVLLAITLRLGSLHWRPASDWAAIELRVREVGGLHTPLVGVYSRYGFSHPGPLLFDWLAVFYRLSGARSAALFAGAFAFHAAVVAVTVWRTTRRRGVVAGAWVGMVLGALALGLHASRLIDPWNPYVPVLGVAALVPLAALALDGDGIACVAALCVASFAAQAHASVAPYAIVMGATAFAGFVIARRDRRRTWQLAGVVVLLWAQPILDAVLYGGGNARTIWDYANADHSSAGARRASEVLSRELALVPGWLRGNSRVDLITGQPVRGAIAVPVVLFVVLAALAYAVRRRDRVAVAATALAAAGIAVAWVTILRAELPLYDYLVLWIRGVGAGALCAIGIAVAPRFARVRAVTAIVATAAIMLGIAVAISVARTPALYREETRALDATAHAIARTRCRFVTGATDALGESVGVLLQLTRAHPDAKGPTRSAGAVGASRTTASPHGCRLYVTVAGTPVPEGARVLVRFDPLTEADRIAMANLQRALVAAGAAHDRAAVARIARSIREDPRFRAVSLVLSELPPLQGN